MSGVAPGAHAGGVTTIDWQDEAACRDADPEAFIGEQMTDEVRHAAQQACTGCPVQADCAGYAREIEAVWGLWAGVWRTPRTPAAERRAAA